MSVLTHFLIFIGVLCLVFVLAFWFTYLESQYNWKHGIVIIPIGPAKDLVVHVTPAASPEQQFKEARASYMEGKLNGEFNGPEYYYHCQHHEKGTEEG